MFEWLFKHRQLGTHLPYLSWLPHSFHTRISGQGCHVIAKVAMSCKGMWLSVCALTYIRYRFTTIHVLTVLPYHFTTLNMSYQCCHILITTHRDVSRLPEPPTRSSPRPAASAQGWQTKYLWRHQAGGRSRRSETTWRTCWWRHGCAGARTLPVEKNMSYVTFWKHRRETDFDCCDWRGSGFHWLWRMRWWWGVGCSTEVEAPTSWEIHVTTHLSRQSQEFVSLTGRRQERETGTNTSCCFCWPNGRPSENAYISRL